MTFPPAHPSLLRALAARNYLEPTPVQLAVLQPDLTARDLLVSAQTGSGKTVAFGLAIAPTLLGEAETFTPAPKPLALVVAPTRELAIQVQRELGWLYANTNARTATCVGGMDIRREQYLLSQGPQIVVGTPGRLCDHLERGTLDLSALRAVVLDEADEMLDMGFREDLERILQATPATRRTLLFSATIPRGIAMLAKQYQRDALRIAASSDTEGHRDIEYHAIPVLPRERERAIVNILRYFDVSGALIFCSTRADVTRLTANLSERGFEVVALSGELSQRERTTALQALRDGRARACVATDVAARGLDLPDLGLVIHADLPNNSQILKHRSGRTGRAGRKGVSVLLVPDAARRYVDRMLQGAHVDVRWTGAPTGDQIRERDHARLLEQIAATAEDSNDEDLAVARDLLAKRSPEELAAALVRLHRAQLPAPEDLTVPPSMRRPTSPPPRSYEREESLAPRPKRDVRRTPRDEAPAPREEARAPRVERTERPAPRMEREAPRAEREAPRAEREAAPAEREETREPRPARTKASTPWAPPTLGDDAPSAAPARAKHPRGVIESTRPPAQMGGDSGGPVWFVVNVGRNKNADPRWLVPLLCRRGDVQKDAIGKIRILTSETHVEIASHEAERFNKMIRRPDEKDRFVHIRPLPADAAHEDAEAPVAKSRRPLPKLGAKPKLVRKR